MGSRTEIRPVQFFSAGYQMCRGLGIDDVLDIGSWTFMHAVAAPMFVNFARLILALAAPAGPIGLWDLGSMHAVFTVLHWTDEWLETHTSYGAEYALHNLWSSDSRCDAESKWMRDSPGDAISGYFGSFAHIGGYALALRAGGRLASVYDATVRARAVHLLTTVALFVTARPLSLQFELHAGGLGATLLFALVAVPFAQLAGVWLYAALPPEAP